MSEWFHVGQKVVFVGPEYSGVGYGDEAFPEVGNIYTNRAIESSGDQTALYLEELVNPVRVYLHRDGHEVVCEGSFNASRFRPLRKRSTDISIFKGMLEPTGGQKVDA